MSVPDPQNKPAASTASTPTTAPKPFSSAPAPAPAKAPRSVGGCIGRMLAALLVIVITTIVALAAVAGGATWLGFTPQSANELRAAQQQVATLEARNTALEGQNVAVQTQIALMIGQAGTDRESLDELRSEVEKFATLSDQVETRLAQDAREQATLVVEMRTSRDAVMVFATAEAGRAQVLSELQRRSERVERFLQRLSDISGDTALDIQSATPTATISSTLTPQITPSPQATATVAASPTVTALTPTAKLSSTVAPDVTATTPVGTPQPTPTKKP